jgi:hypothetical protein
VVVEDLDVEVGDVALCGEAVGLPHVGGHGLAEAEEVGEGLWTAIPHELDDDALLWGGRAELDGVEIVLVVVVVVILQGGVVLAGTSHGTGGALLFEEVVLLLGGFLDLGSVCWVGSSLCGGVAAVAPGFESTGLATLEDAPVELAEGVCDAVYVFAALPIVCEEDDFAPRSYDAVVVVADDVGAGREDGERDDAGGGEERGRYDAGHGVAREREEAVCEDHEVEAGGPALFGLLVAISLTDVVELVVVWLAVALVYGALVPDPVLSSAFFELLLDLEADDASFGCGRDGEEVLCCVCGW